MGYVTCINDSGRRKLTAEILTKRKVVFSNSVPFADMKISEHIFDRLDEIFAQKPISQLIDDGMKQNWGTGSQILKKLENHTVPYSVPLLVFEAEISRTKI